MLQVFMHSTFILHLLGVAWPLSSQYRCLQGLQFAAFITVAGNSIKVDFSCICQKYLNNISCSRIRARGHCNCAGVQCSAPPSLALTPADGWDATKVWRHFRTVSKTKIIY